MRGCFFLHIWLLLKIQASTVGRRKCDYVYLGIHYLVLLGPLCCPIIVNHSHVSQLSTWTTYTPWNAYNIVLLGQMAYFQGRAFALSFWEAKDSFKCGEEFDIVFIRGGGIWWVKLSTSFLEFLDCYLQQVSSDSPVSMVIVIYHYNPFIRIPIKQAVFYGR